MGIDNAAVDAFGDPDRSSLTRVMAKVGHWAIPAGLVYVPLGIVSHVWPDLVPAGVGTVVAVGFFVVWLAVLVHQNFGRICVACMREVPRNAARWAQRLRGFLWYDHHPVIQMTTQLGVVAATWSTAAGWPGALVYVVFAVMMVGTWAHHRLRPWCPYCRGWDDEGPKERVPNPDPSGIKTRS